MKSHSNVNTLTQAVEQASAFNTNVEQFFVRLGQVVARAEQARERLEERTARSLELIRMERDTALDMIRREKAGTPPRQRGYDLSNMTIEEN